MKKVFWILAGIVFLSGMVLALPPVYQFFHAPEVTTGLATENGLVVGDINAGSNVYASLTMNAVKGFRAPSANGQAINGGSCFGTTCSTGVAVSIGGNGLGSGALRVTNAGGNAIDIDGNITMRSPNGHIWNCQVDNSGQLVCS